jgi:hypothetical protein
MHNVGKGYKKCPDGTIVHAGTMCRTTNPKKKEKVGPSTSTIIGLSVGIPLGVLFIILIGLLLNMKYSTKTTASNSFTRNYAYDTGNGNYVPSTTYE